MSQAAGTLGQAAVRGRGIVVDAAFVVAGTLLVALSAQVRIPLPFTPVPLTGQTFGVLLVGASLGASMGTASLFLYLLAGAVGLPFYAGGAHGWDVVQGATGGYLVGFIVSALVVGFLAERGWDRKIGRSMGAMLIGTLVIYLFGLAWLSQVLDAGLERTLEAGLYPFLLGDLLKLLLAAAVLPTVWKLVGRRSR
ncbi:MAG: biotin transporter BioY [Actinomycetota bacterium]|nr:biotin transporter BioY [Actinomycetota bacterium]